MKFADWDCDACGATGNFARRTTCFKCDAPKPDNPTLTKPKVDWDCTECGATGVFGSRTTCFKCNAPKPENAPPSAGKKRRAGERPPDWDCAECGATGCFGSKTNCFKCGAERPKTDEENTKAEKKDESSGSDKSSDEEAGSSNKEGLSAEDKESMVSMVISEVGCTKDEAMKAFES